MNILNTNIDGFVETRVKQHYSFLSAKEKAAADVVLKDKAKVAKMSVNEWANAAKTSKASIVRFCQSLGFNGAEEFKKYLENESYLPSDTIVWNTDDTSSIADLARSVCLSNINTIYESLLVLDLEKVELVAKAVLSTREILLLGTGASGTVAYTLQNGLLQLGITSYFVTDSATQMLMAAKADKNTLVIVMNHSGAEKSLIDSVQFAKDQGAKVVSILGIVGSPLDSLSDISLYCGLTSTDYISDLMTSRMSELNVISILLAVISKESGDKLDSWMEQKQRVFETRHVLRKGPDKNLT